MVETESAKCPLGRLADEEKVVCVGKVFAFPDSQDDTDQSSTVAKSPTAVRRGEDWIALRVVSWLECGVVPLSFFDVPFQPRFPVA